MAGWLAAMGAEATGRAAPTDPGHGFDGVDCEGTGDARRGCDGASSGAIASGWAGRFWKRMLLGSAPDASKTLRDAFLDPAAVVVGAVVVAAVAVVVVVGAVVVAAVAVVVAVAVAIIDVALGLGLPARGDRPACAGRTGERAGDCC